MKTRWSSQTTIRSKTSRRADTPGRVDVLSYSANEWAVRVESPGEALLVNTDTNYPGWEAAIDGHPARIYTADVAFRAIRLPPGKHEVRMHLRAANFVLVSRAQRSGIDGRAVGDRARASDA